MIGIKDVNYFQSRIKWLIKTGEWPKETIDHINGDKADDRWVNLREATENQQKLNRLVGRRRKINLPMGVHKHWKKFKAKSGINGKVVTIGIFDTPEKAYDAYIKYRQENSDGFFNVKF